MSLNFIYIRKVCYSFTHVQVRQMFAYILVVDEMQKCTHTFISACFYIREKLSSHFFLLFRPLNEIFFLPHLFFLCQLSFVENIQYIYRWFPQGKQKERKEIHHHYSTSLRFKKLHKRGIY